MIGFRRFDGSLTLGGRTFTISKQFLDDLEEHNLLAGLPRLNKAPLVFHAPRDEYVGIDNATAIFTAARHPKSLINSGGLEVVFASGTAISTIIAGQRSPPGFDNLAAGSAG